MSQYKLSKRAAVCAISETPFQNGDELVSAIYPDEGEGFVRRDMLATHYAAQPAAFSHWRTVHAVAPKPDRRLDYALALDFFQRLVAEADPARENLTFTLALLLVRKRRLKLGASRTLPEGDLLEVILRGEEQDETLQVRAPRMTPEQADAVQAELAALFGFAEPPAAEEATAEVAPDGLSEEEAADSEPAAL